MDFVIVGLPETLAGQQPQEPTETTGTTEEEQNPILPETDELIFGTIAFLIVFVVLARFAYPRIKGMMEARTERIRTDLEKAEEAKSEAEGILRRYEDQLREARSEAGRIIEEARKTADSMRQDLMAKAEEESRQIVARAQEEIRAERARAFDDLRREVGKLSVDLAERLVRESLDKDRHLRLVEDYIEELTRSGGNGES